MQHTEPFFIFLRTHRLFFMCHINFLFCLYLRITLYPHSIHLIFKYTIFRYDYMRKFSKEISKIRRTSPIRWIISYVGLCIVSLIPISLYILSPHLGIWNFKTVIFAVTIGEIIIEVSFAGYMIPIITSAMIGASGGFLLWCWYSRGRCMRNQKPNVLQLYS